MPKPPPSAVDQVVSLAKRRGFVYPCGEIYGGTRSAWDYGPLGVELKENIKRQWWKAMVQSRDDMVGLDSSIILPRQVWEASGHVDTFTDPLTECQSCHKRFRADHLQEEYGGEEGRSTTPTTVDLATLACPNCGTRGAWTEPRQFSGLLKTYLGVIEDEDRAALPASRDRAGHLRQLRQRRDQLARRSRRSASPRSARASATRSRPATSSSAPASSSRWRWSSSSSPARTRSGTSTGSTSAPAGTSTSASTPTTCATTSTRRRSSATTRRAPSTSSTASASPGSEWGELEGIANRTDFDLTTHSKHSGQDLSYFDQAANERYTPYVIEPAAGLSRSLMTFLVDAYSEDEAPNTKGGVDTRTVLRLDPRLAPVKVAVLPLSRNADLSPKAKALAAELRRGWNVDFDDSGAIGRRYRRQDEIGTPYCVTVDFETLEDDAVTVRERDTMQQERVPLAGITSYFAERFVGC